MKDLAQQIRLLDLIKNLSADEITKVMAGEDELDCEKCILKKSCKATIGATCGWMMKEYIEGRTW